LQKLPSARVAAPKTPLFDRKIAKIPKNSTIKPLSRRGGGQRKKHRKKQKRPKVPLSSLYLLYLYHVWKSRWGHGPSLPTPMTVLLHHFHFKNSTNVEDSSKNWKVVPLSNIFLAAFLVQWAICSEIAQEILNKKYNFGNTVEWVKKWKGRRKEFGISATYSESWQQLDT